MPKSQGRAILACKCPRCREGEMFVHSPTKKWYSRKMYDRCPVCAQTYEPEPGFFFGAMYVSYGFSVALMTITGIVLNFLFDEPDLWIYVVTVSGLVAVLWPIMYRYSRSIFLHLFGGVRFDPKYGGSE